ncbi:hypothetical protein FOZ61_003001 [Perkinsus olseni]|uniref:Uncharacterized protein n=1 Tax=Perkinsus olseni TaxID=32597 RepID=A0A7J6MTB7_PEROL|nr:hypothetical protein FOZ61_003001 [Perkinsus olseni]KAF4674832.1 hypothetical protein FOL46_003824 [Perkinsus olseni]
MRTTLFALYILSLTAIPSSVMALQAASRTSTRQVLYKRPRPPKFRPLDRNITVKTRQKADHTCDKSCVIEYPSLTVEVYKSFHRRRRKDFIDLYHYQTVIEAHTTGEEEEVLALVTDNPGNNGGRYFKMESKHNTSTSGVVSKSYGSRFSIDGSYEKDFMKPFTSIVTPLISILSDGVDEEACSKVADYIEQNASPPYENEKGTPWIREYLLGLRALIRSRRQ